MPLYLMLKEVARTKRQLACSDAALIITACEEISKGLIDADLGGNLFKKRVPIHGKGKSGSLRTIIAMRQEERWFFLALWAKNDLANIPPKELKQMKKAAKKVLALSNQDISNALTQGFLVEVKADQD